MTDLKEALKNFKPKPMAAESAKPSDLDDDLAAFIEEYDSASDYKAKAKALRGFLEMVKTADQ